MSHNTHDHKKTYLRVWGALLVLTVITVNVAYHDFGIWNIVIAMLVATIKASLVILYFMHLKYDNRVNQVVFCSAFSFLAIFVALTASDLFFRPVDRPVTVENTPEAAGGTAGDAEKLRVATPELVAQGKTLYAGQCATCHGAAGAGDGAAAGALNPRPRDLTSADGWKSGRTPTQIFKTLTDGSPGTAMASFAGIPAKDRWALVHYIRTLSPTPPEDTPEMIAALTGGASAPAAQPTARIPVPFAMQMMTEPDAAPTQDPSAPLRTGSGRRAQDKETPGGRLYARDCASCHGTTGAGGIKVRTIGVAPYVHLKTRPLATARGTWATSEPDFIRIISQGLPGFGKPGITHFTPSEWHVLYEHVRTLAE